MKKRKREKKEKWIAPTFSETDLNIYLYDNHLSIPKSTLPPLEYMTIANDCIIPSKVKKFKSKLPLPPSICHREENDRLIIPKYYGLSLKKEYIDIQEEGEPSEHLNDMNVELDENRHQVSAFNEVYSALMKHGGATLSLPPGEGKTEVALKIAETIKKKVAVLGHNTTVLDTWIERVPQRFPKVKVGLLQGDICTYENCDVVVISIPSLINGKYNRDIMKRFGLIIIDECHRIDAVEWCKCFKYLCAKYILALSGTPKRRDGKELLLQRYIGPVTYIAQRIYNVPVHVHYYEFKYPKPEVKMDWDGSYNAQNLRTILGGIFERNLKVIDIMDEWKETKRQVLFVSDRVEHLEILRSMTMFKYGTYDDPKTCLFVGDKKKSATFDEAKEAQWIFSTFAKASEAMNIPTLSIIVLLMPKYDVIQAIARILRDKNPEFEPVIIDFFESCFNFEGLFWTRHEFFKSENFIFHWHFTRPKNVKKKEIDRPPPTVCPFK